MLKVLLMAYLIYWFVSGFSYCLSTFVLYWSAKSVLERDGVPISKNSHTTLLFIDALRNFKEAYKIMKGEMYPRIDFLGK